MREESRDRPCRSPQRSAGSGSSRGSADRALLLLLAGLVLLGGLFLLWRKGGGGWLEPARSGLDRDAPAASARESRPRGAAERSGIADPPATAGALRGLLTNTRHPGSIRPDFRPLREELEALYAERGYDPLWFAEGRPRRQVEAVLDLLAAAGEHGLAPEDYDASRLAASWAPWKERVYRAAPGEIAELDAGTSLALMRFLNELHAGRIRPQQLGYGLEVKRRAFALAPFIREAAVTDSLGAIVATAEPPLHQYRALRAALPRFRALAADTSLPAPPFAGKLRPGAPYAGAARLAHVLRAYGDLPADSAGAPGPAVAVPPVYDGPLVAGIRRFQERHGLEPDGIIGARTWAHLRTSPAQRARQIELGLERLRWLPEMAPGPHVLVNIPAFRLYAFEHPEEAGPPALEMAVVVGEAARNETPVFADRMQYLVFSPYWYPPRSIIEEEILPALDRDPGYLDRKAFELVASTSDDARAVPPTGDNLEKLRAGSLRVRQRPGAQNSLGHVKFIFPNSFNVYLHDTPSRGLFRREERDFSHGCIRVERPIELALWVLRDQPEWTRETIESAMRADRPRHVPLRNQLPIYILYSTVLARPDGGVGFFEDIYGYDPPLDQALRGAETTTAAVERSGPAAP